MHANVLDAAQAFLLVVDLQETYRDKLFEWERTVDRCARLIRGARLLGMPIVCTEQYPKGLGHTAAEIRSVLDAAPIFEKRSLSALGNADVQEAIEALGRRHALVCGIETHACINQSVHDLLDLGFRVHVPEDAVSAGHERVHAAGRK